MRPALDLAVPRTASCQRTLAALASHASSRQRGQALIVLIAMLSIATTLLVYGSTTAVGRTLAADARTRAALEEAKQALIGRAVADSNRPGSMPCPDTDDDGSADLFVGSACPSYIGRLPWRTLGTGDLRDAGGERLWYVLSPAFRDHPLAPPLNSDTPGALSVYSNTTARVVTTEAIAIVFAPGESHSAQRRDVAASLCQATGRNVPRSRCATNYLDSLNNINNASASGPFIAVSSGDFFNDKLAVIVAADVMPLVERRVAAEIRDALLAYRRTSACRCYPWPDSSTDGSSDVGANKGRVPTATALPHPWPAGMLPSYVAANQWALAIFYAVARTGLENSGASCKTCVDPNLSVDGVGGYEMLLITPGYADRRRSTGAWHDYIDDPPNRDGDDHFARPASSGPSRDNLYATVGAAAACAATAQVLMDYVPCGQPGNTIRAVCTAGAAALATCGCAAAAATLLQAPCTTTIATRNCELAMSQLRGCT